MELKIMSGTKICKDCGKQFISEFEESAVICEDCVALLKRRFWSSIKIGKAYDNITDLA
jgi:DNA-directed RNA polymerase subunit RPC12/RpoP